MGDFRVIATQGTKVSSGPLVCRWIPSQDGNIRLAFVMRKKNGNAPFRNRLRRILRHRFFSYMENSPFPLWGVVQFYGNRKDFCHGQFLQNTDTLLQRLGWKP